MVKFFNPLVLEWSLYEVLGYNRYVDMLTENNCLLSLFTGHLGCQQSPVDGSPIAIDGYFLRVRCYAVWLILSTS